MMVNIPNFLTIVRIALIPVFAYLLVKQRFAGALAVFAAGSVTDALDGFIARRFNQVTALGRMLDPLADKLFILTSYSAAYLGNLLPIWLLLLAWLKEIIVVTGYAMLHTVVRRVEIRPDIFGKGSTFMQMATIIAVLAGGIGLEIEEPILETLFAATAIAIAASTVSYVVTGIRIYSRGDIHG